MTGYDVISILHIGGKANPNIGYVVKDVDFLGGD
jgi:hypothetical protein